MNKSDQILFDGEERYKDLFDNAHDLIHFAQPDGSLLYVNPSWMKLLEYSQEEIQGKSVYSFIEQPDRDIFIQYRKDLINGTIKDKEITITAKTKTGKKIKLQGFVSAKIKDGKPLYTRGIFRDITTKLVNEEKIRERETNFQQLLIHAPDAIIVIDQESKILFWNPKAEQIFGWTQEETLGQLLSQKIIPSQYRQAHESGMKRYLATGEARVLNKTIDITALHKNGTEFYVSLTISTTKQNGVTAFIAFLRDITEQKKNEQELQKKKSELEASNQELENFAHVASHDLKEPLRKIRTFESRLSEEFKDQLPEKSKLYLEKIQKAAERMTKMVDGVLAYSIVNSKDHVWETIDLNRVIDDIKNDLELLLQQNNGSIKHDVLPKLRGMPALIYQLFYNLISNALKFAKKDEPLIITITAKEPGKKEISEPVHFDPSKMYIEIDVKDNGIGFDPSKAEKIFHVFTRLDTTYEGTGLGLALCKKIAERHGGIITAEGVEGKGACFKIILPE